MKIKQITYDDLAVSSEELEKIQELIMIKENMLINKRKDLHKLYHQNKFLESVKYDYNKYLTYIVRQKEEQMESLQLLNDYINNLIMSGELKKYDIDDAKIEQNKIMSEIKNIKANLNNIIGKTNNIGKII